MKKVLILLIKNYHIIWHAESNNEEYRNNFQRSTEQRQEQ